MNNQTEEKKFVCKSCGSESPGTPNTCCGAERKEKVEDKDGEGKSCSTCGAEREQDGSPACGCK